MTDFGSPSSANLSLPFNSTSNSWISSSSKLNSTWLDWNSTIPSLVANNSSNVTATNSSIMHLFRIRPDLFFCNQTFDDDDDGHLDRQEMDHFKLTEQNLKDSRTNECYGNWSSFAMHDPRYGNYKGGEVELFAEQFGFSSDFRCGFHEEGQCIQHPDYHSLLHRYNGIGDEGRSNWPHIRRVFFMFRQFENYHRFARKYTQNLFEIHLDLKELIPSFLATFAPHADPKDQQICKFRQDLIKFGISTSMNLITSTVGAISMGVVGPLANQAFASFMVQFTDAFTGDGAVLGAGGKLDVRTNFWMTEETRKEIKKEINGTFGGLPAKAISTVYDDVAGEFKGLVTPDIFDTLFPKQDSFQAPDSLMEDSINKNPFCGDLDVADSQSPQNIKKLRQGMQEFFEYLRGATISSYRKLFKGQPVPGKNESALASLFATLKWTDEHDESESIEGAMAYAEEWKKRMKTKLVKQIAGKILADGHGYVKCTYEKNALKHCESARKGKHNDFSNAIFCPRPKDDPSMICVGARIYVDGTGMTRERELPIRPDYAKKGDPDHRLAGWREFGITNYRDLMKENDEDYQKNHNKMFMRVGPVGIMDTTGGFRLPTCIHEHVHLYDFTVYDTTRWHERGGFPMICGDHRANETRAFLKDIGIVSGEKRHDDIFTDRMPKSLKGISPYESFVALCQMQVKWPDWNGVLIGENHSRNRPENWSSMPLTSSVKLSNRSPGIWVIGMPVCEALPYPHRFMRTKFLITGSAIAPKGERYSGKKLHIRTGARGLRSARSGINTTTARNQDPETNDLDRDPIVLKSKLGTGTLTIPATSLQTE